MYVLGSGDINNLPAQYIHTINTDMPVNAIATIAPVDLVVNMADIVAMVAEKLVRVVEMEVGEDLMII